MITIYTYDDKAVYSGAVQCDPLKPVPVGLLVPPPALSGDEVAQARDGKWVVLPAYPVMPPEPPVVPSAVTMRQARLALLGAGLLDDVDAAINAMPSPQKEAARIAWEYSQEVQRHNGFVSVLAPMLGLTEAQTDALFFTAAGL